MRNDELNNADFVDFFLKTKKFFKAYYKLITLGSLIGIGISISNYYLADNYYTTDFVTTDGSNIEKGIIKDLINHNEEHHISAENLKLSAEKIAIIRQDFLNVKKIFVDTSMQNGLEFKLKIYNNDADLKSIKNSVLSLLADNIHLYEHSKNKKRQLKLALKGVQQEIQVIDSLQNIMLLNTKALTINSTDFSKNLVDLKRYQIELEEEIDELGKYKTIRAIYRPKNPERSLSSAVLFGSILGFFLSLVFGVFHQINQLSKVRI